MPGEHEAKAKEPQLQELKAIEVKRCETRVILLRHLKVSRRSEVSLGRAA